MRVSAHICVSARQNVSMAFVVNFPVHNRSGNVQVGLIPTPNHPHSSLCEFIASLTVLAALLEPTALHVK